MLVLLIGSPALQDGGYTEGMGPGLVSGVRAAWVKDVGGAAAAASTLPNLVKETPTVPSAQGLGAPIAGPGAVAKQLVIETATPTTAAMPPAAAPGNNANPMAAVKKAASVKGLGAPKADRLSPEIGR